jgi:Na+-transporting NADH:ubiquinone oxidoreductase subunit F
MVAGLLAVGVTTSIFIILSAVLLVAEKYLADYGECVISINEGASVLEQKGGSSLLSALIDNKVFIPSACGGKGSCGFCKVEVHSGGGPILPTETPFVTRTEIRSGVRLACQVKVKQDLELAIPEELLSVKEYDATVASERYLTYDIKEVTFDLIEPAEIEQRPGQYIQIRAPGPDGPVFRAYSISSPAYEKDKVQIVVRLIPGGIASTYIHSLSVGDRVMFTGPYGEFKLSEEETTDIVCVGGGAGMAPITSIIHYVYSKWENRTCYLFFGCRTTKDVFYLEEFKELAKTYPNLKIIYALSDPIGEGEKWDGESGFIHLSVDKYLEFGKKSQAFLCGPPPMIEAVTDVLGEKGLKSEDIFYDKF